jgi:hypothetical protein
MMYMIDMSNVGNSIHVLVVDRRNRVAYKGCARLGIAGETLEIRKPSAIMGHTWMIILK